MPQNTLIVISGPTASGKTDLAVRLAGMWGCPVLSADSRQVFQKVNIGTAKPPLEILQKLPHFFIDHVEIDGSYNAGLFEKEASALLDDLFRKHEKVIVCGGTGLYLKALIKGMDDLPASDENIRNALNKLYQEEGLQGLQKRVQEIDPEYFAKVDINNPRRLMRALEVFTVSGNAYSSLREQKPSEREFAIREICLTPERSILYERINARVDQMMRMGLLEETLQLKDYRHTQAMDTVGYKELFAYLDGTISLEIAIELIKQHTRNFAKRQLTWFRKESTGPFVDPNDTVAIQEFLKGLTS